MLSDVTRRVPAPDTTPLADGDPAELGGYEVRARLGQGGMGVVYLGATRSGRRLAIKVIQPESSDQREFRARFRREASAAAKVRSRRTVALVDFDVDTPRPWLATEYVPGPTLAHAVAALGHLPEAAVRELAGGLAEALDAIHREGLVHRDLKPANVLLGPDGPVVIDLGIVSDSDATSLTTTGMQPGTPPFMSPEQARGEAVTAASDVWSLGAVTHLAATGTPPFGTGSLAAVTYRIVHEPPDLEALPAGLRQLVGACLAKDPAARPTAAEVLAALSGPSEDETVRRAVPSPDTVPPAHATPSDLPGRSPGRVRRKVLAGLVGVGLVLAGGGGAVATAHFLAPGDEPAVTAPPQAEADPTPERSGSPRPRPTRSEPTPTAESSGSPESSPVAAPAEDEVAGSTDGQAAEPVDEQDQEPVRFRPGSVLIPAAVQVGQKVTAETAGWDPEPATTTCRWSVGGEERDNLGSCTYVVALGDVGKPLRAGLTATRPGYARVTVLSNATGTVPQPSVARPGCSVTLVPGKANAGWRAYCEVDQDPDVTYTWTWVDIDSGETIRPKDYVPGPNIWIHGGHHGSRVTVTVEARREGYRSAEFSTTFTLPDEWVPAG